MFNKISFVFLAAISVFIAGCSSFSPYKMEIRQGNYVAEDARQKIRLGMSRQQVVSVLGSPLVSDVFHANRWDYIYRLEEKAKVVEQQRLTLYFEGDFVKRIDDSRAAEAPESGKSLEKGALIVPVK